MAKDEFDEFEDEDEQIEDEEEEAPKKPVKKMTPTDKASVTKYSKPKEAESSVTYSAYHIPERLGIKDDNKNEPVGEDVYSILAVVLNKLQKIEEAVC